MLLIATACQPAGTIKTEQGLVTGTPGADPAVTVYKGIPFAEPPVGTLRWQPPQAPASWEGVREAVSFSDGCVQPLQRSRPPWTEEYMHQGHASEDCLYLNIWTTAESGDDTPVLVYIHGGGFNEGSGSVALYDGEALAKKGLVVVTINYRLGLLGFLAHPELTAESPENASGNYGLLDQIAALQWIQNNISGFGGDAGNVTIAGQSAGAMSVYLLTSSPLASGLFHRAINQSGPGGLASFGLTGIRSMAPALADAEAGGMAFAEGKGATSIADLRSLSVALLTENEEDASPLRFGPVIDGYFLTKDMADVYASSEHHDVPLLSGFNADEASAFPGYGQMTVEALQEMAASQYAESSATFLSLYPAATDEEAGEAQVASFRDMAAVAVQKLAASRAQTSSTPEYVYYFERGIPWPERPEFQAFHSGEVPYVFNNLHLLERPWEDSDKMLADQTSSYWANFATHGDPNGEGLPDWPAYTAANNAVMVLGQNTGLREMPESADKRAFFESVLAE